jgi:hypothetical protein
MIQRLLCRLGMHAERDQGLVGYCRVCGDFKPVHETRYMWTRYVLPPPRRNGKPPGLPPRRVPPRAP